MQIMHIWAPSVCFHFVNLVNFFQRATKSTEKEEWDLELVAGTGDRSISAHRTGWHGHALLPAENSADSEDRELM